jgi:pilus assembly protein Flp/PilA
MLQLVKSFWKEEEGVTAIEYGLIAALLAVAIVVGVSAAGVSLNGLFTRIANCLDATSASVCALV